MATKISVINFKGGVGKTTLSFHLAAYLARTKKVLVIDVDHQSSLSLVMLGGALWEAAAEEKQTCNSIFESFCNRKVSMPGKEIIIENPLLKRSGHNFYPNLDLVSAQLQLDDTEIDLASTTIGSAMLSEWNKRTLLAEWLDSVNANEEYDYIIFDCPPATKLVSQNALAASDFFLIPVIPDEMSSRGVTHFRDLVTGKIDNKLDFLWRNGGVDESAVPKSYVPETRLAGIVPFMIKPAGGAYSGMSNLHTTQLHTLKEKWGDDLIDVKVKNLTGVAEAMNDGWPVWNAYETANIRRAIPMLQNACKKIFERISV